MVNEMHAADIFSFFRVSVRNMEDGKLHTALLTTAAEVVAWMESHPEVTEWRVKGSFVTKPGSEYRNGGTTSMRYFEDGFTAEQLKTQFALGGH